jgi:hypothetical protein
VVQGTFTQLKIVIGIFLISKGLTNTQYARLVEIVGSHDLGVGITLGAHQVWMKTSIKSIESFITIFIFLYLGNSIGGVMVRVLTSSAVDRGFES